MGVSGKLYHHCHLLMTLSSDFMSRMLGSAGLYLIGAVGAARCLCDHGIAGGGRGRERGSPGCGWGDLGGMGVRWSLMRHAVWDAGAGMPLDECEGRRSIYLYA